MAKVKATVSFAGAVSMAQGEVRDIEDKAILDDLLRAGHVVPAEEPKKAAAEAPKKAAAKSTSKKGGK